MTKVTPRHRGKPLRRSAQGRGREPAGSGPFGSYAANPVTRIAFWTGLFWIGTALLWLSLGLGVVHGARLRFPPLFAGLVAVLAGCVPLALVAGAAAHLCWPVRASAMRFVDWYGLTLVPALPAALLAYRLEIGALPPAAAATPPAIPPAAEDGPLPEHLAATALCLQMEDHYVRIHGPARSHLHLGALRDAVRQLDGRRGLQVHRSWWVAADAVRAVEEDKRAVTLLLRNGLRVPVARGRVALLREQGWLDATEEAAA